MKQPLRRNYDDVALFLADLTKYGHEQKVLREQLAAMFADSKWREAMPLWEKCLHVSVIGAIEENLLEPVLNNIAGSLAEVELYPLEVAKVRCEGTEAFVVRTG